MSLENLIPLSVAVRAAKEADASPEVIDAIESEDAVLEREWLLNHAIRELASDCHAASARNGFWDGPRNKGEMIALIHSELSEMLEAVRKPELHSKCPPYSAEEEEAADVLIRLLDYCHGHGLDLAGAYQAKMRFNATRPYKHGKGF